MNSRGIIELEKENGYILLSIRDSYKVTIEVEDMIDFAQRGYGNSFIFSNEEKYTGSLVFESKKDFQIKLKVKKIAIIELCEIVTETLCLNCSKFHNRSEECILLPD